MTPESGVEIPKEVQEWQEPKTNKQEEPKDKFDLEVFENFNRTETEQFTETNKKLFDFTKEVGEKFSVGDQSEIYDACMLMFTLHMYQKDRPDKSPYVEHPLNVAVKVIRMMANPDKDLAIAALLHDAVEDQSGKLALLAENSQANETEEVKALGEIARKYGERVRQIVSGLSNPDFEKVLSERGVNKENPEYQSAKNKMYAEHVQEAIKDPDVLVIKLADFSENALRLSELPEDTIERKQRKQQFIAKYLPVMKIFIDKIEREQIFPEYIEKLKTEYNKFNQ